MNIEEILRRIIREELEAALGMRKGNEEQVEEQPVTSPPIRYEVGPNNVKISMKMVRNAQDLVGAIKELCGDDAVKASKAKGILVSEGYTRFSAVDDDHAQEVYDMIVRRTHA